MTCHHEIRFGPREPTEAEQIEQAKQIAAIVTRAAQLKGARMGPKMRAKLTVQSVTDNGYSDQVKFSAIYSDNKEDNSFADATPNASADFTINNKALRGLVKPGQKYYVDFIPIES